VGTEKAQIFKGGEWIFTPCKIVKIDNNINSRMGTWIFRTLENTSKLG